MLYCILVLFLETDLTPLLSHPPVHGRDGLLVVVVLRLHRAQQPPGLGVARVALALRLQRNDSLCTRGFNVSWKYNLL